MSTNEGEQRGAQTVRLKSGIPLEDSQQQAELEGQRLRQTELQELQMTRAQHSSVRPSASVFSDSESLRGDVVPRREAHVQQATFDRGTLRSVMLISKLTPRTRESSG